MAGLMEGRAALPGSAPPGLDRIVLQVPARIARRIAIPPRRACWPISARCKDRRQRRRRAPVTTAPPSLWWWQFHQATLAVLDAATPVLALLVRQSLRAPYGRWIFLAVLALATIAVIAAAEPALHVAGACLDARGRTGRGCFPGLPRRRVCSPSSCSLSAFALGTECGHHGRAIALGGLILVASLAIIEPATTSGAGLRQEGLSNRILFKLFFFRSPESQ